MNSVFTNIFIFFIIWWLALFAVLPWGVRRNENPTAGHDPGAPVHPLLWKKVFATTAVALVIWGCYFAVTQILGFSLADLVGAHKAAGGS